MAGGREGGGRRPENLSSLPVKLLEKQVSCKVLCRVKELLHVKSVHSSTEDEKLEQRADDRRSLNASLSESERGAGS